MTDETRPAYRSPLEPINSIIVAILTLFAGGALIVLVLTAFGRGSFLGFGRTTPMIDLPVVEQGHITAPWAAEPGVSVTTTGYRVSMDHPDLAQRAWDTLYGLPSVILFIGGLVLGRWIVSRAGREGLYSVATARRVRTLGWFLIAGDIGRTLIREIAGNRLLDTMVTNHVGWITGMYLDFSWTLLIFGATLLTIARIMRIGARMSSELEGTV